MINANELRIGNLVQDLVSGELMLVDEIGESVGATIIDRSKYPLPDGWRMGPIPLTEEWLQRIGFIDTAAGYLLTMKYPLHYSIIMHPSYDDGMPRLMTNDGRSVSYLAQNVRFVHQLQNLFFALTGEELTVKL